MKKVFYEKVGRRYVPVYEYDSELLDGFPKGHHLVSVYPGGQSRRFNIDPNYAAVLAATRLVKEEIVTQLMKASEVKQGSNTPLTPEQREAWDNLIRVFGDSARCLHWNSAHDIAEAGIKVLEAEAAKLLENPALQSLWDQYLLVAELTKENNDTKS